ncbi:hypothetical protein ACH5RR_010091 [Cinchona calisaya]|uniref:Uncharacterized protein n=1 Tax=Cinchona calisaya TaxID=153742 RepID=A0ABD3AGK8_9GENT
MDTLFPDHANSTDGFQQLDQYSSLSENGNLVNGCQLNQIFRDVPVNGNLCPDEDSPVECDYFDGVFKYLQQMLMEEEDDLANKPCMFQDCSALQAAEKSFYQVLNESPSSSSTRSPSPTAILGNHNFNSPIDEFAEIWRPNAEDRVVLQESLQSNFQLTSIVDYLMESCSNHSQIQESSVFSSSNPVFQFGEIKENTSDFLRDEKSSNESREKSNRCREHGDHDNDERQTKHFASYSEEIDNTEEYDDALLCPARNPNFYGESPARVGEESSEKEGTKKQLYVPPTTAKRGRPRAGQKRESIREVVDLRDLLTRCANAIANYDNFTANELLKKIRQNSSPGGDPTERLAHCFANALEARIAGMGTTLYTASTAKRASAADVLKAYKAYIEICPFQRMSNIFANKSIGRLTGKATRIHIIDFGILYGFQWPCLIHGISLRPGGPPKLRITGIDHPQPGFRPAERIEETGRRLENYAKRFNVPFEFNAIAKRWDSITEKDLVIDKDEILVVNCLYRLRNVPDETVIQTNNPRDSVMNLIKKLNPNVFVHGVLNGTYGGPFFVTRFKEALYHFSSLFDMFEATLPREDQDRAMFEKEVIGRDIMNVIGCEGTERVERPDPYKQWQVRNQRTGFRQLPLNSEIMREVRSKVKSSYHKEFLVDEHSNWMLQGWKGRVIYALSCWQPSGT